MFRLPHVLFAVIDTRLWSIDQIRAWADKLITEMTDPASWLLNVSVATTSEEAANAVREALRARGVVLPEDIGGLLIGLLCRRFTRGDSARAQFIAEVADVLDAYEVSGPDVEMWSLQMAEESEPSLSTRAWLNAMEQEATARLAELEEVEHVRSDPFFREI